MFDSRYFKYIYANVVGITTCYGLDGRGSNSCVRDIILTRPGGPGAHQPPIQRVPGLFLWDKAVGEKLPSSTEVKERVKLNF